MKPWGALALAGLLMASCGPALLLDTVQSQVEEAGKSLAPPQITPTGGMFRTRPPITLTNPTSGASLFYTFDQNPLVFSTLGQTGKMTFRADQSPFGVGTDTFPGNIGLHNIHAVAWKDGKVSKQTSVSFGIVGDGGARWARAGFGTSGGEALAVVQNAYDSIVTGGWMIDNQGRQMGFLTWWGNAGNQQWMVPISSDMATSTSRVTGLATDTPGNVYAVGTFNAPDTYHFGTGPTLTVAQKSGFLAKFDPSGACLWAVSLEAAGLSLECTGVALAKATGDLYLCGWVDGTGVPLDLGQVGGGFTTTGSFSPKKGTNAFLARYDLAGQPVNAFFSGDDYASDKFYAVAVDESWSRVTVVGDFTVLPGGLTLDYGTVSPTGTLGLATAVTIQRT